MNYPFYVDQFRIDLSNIPEAAVCDKTRTERESMTEKGGGMVSLQKYQHLRGLFTQSRRDSNAS